MPYSLLTKSKQALPGPAVVFVFAEIAAARVIANNKKKVIPGPICSYWAKRFQEAFTRFQPF
jgi:hypothetical protein